MISFFEDLCCGKIDQKAQHRTQEIEDKIVKLENSRRGDILRKLDGEREEKRRQRGKEESIEQGLLGSLQKGPVDEGCEKAEREDQDRVDADHPPVIGIAVESKPQGFERLHGDRTLRCARHEYGKGSSYEHRSREDKICVGSRKAVDDGKAAVKLKAFSSEQEEAEKDDHRYKIVDGI